MFSFQRRNCSISAADVFSFVRRIQITKERGKDYVVNETSNTQKTLPHSDEPKTKKKESLETMMDVKENKNLVEIFNKISHGLRDDYIEPETKHVWKVKDYLEKRSGGIRVYTQWGRFLGTAYVNPQFTSKEK